MFKIEKNPSWHQKIAIFINFKLFFAIISTKCARFMVLETHKYWHI